MAAIAEAEHTVGVDVGERGSSSRPASWRSRRTARSSSAAAGRVVLATVVGRTEAREGADFFPLTVDIEEKMYAAGKIPGGFFKREGRAAEKATLNARMVDRPIRPLFPKGFRNEVQVIGTVLSADRVARARHPGDQRRLGRADALAAALLRARSAPCASALIEGELRASTRPCPRWRTRSLDLIVCGTADAITMVEAGADSDRRGRPDRGARAGPRARSSSIVRGAARAAGEGRQAEVVRPGRRGRARASATAAALRRGDRRAGAGGRARPPRPRCSPPSCRPSRRTPARTSWCAATRCAPACASSPTRAARRP